MLTAPILVSHGNWDANRLPRSQGGIPPAGTRRDHIPASVNLCPEMATARAKLTRASFPSRGPFWRRVSPINLDYSVTNQPGPYPVATQQPAGAPKGMPIQAPGRRELHGPLRARMRENEAGGA